jgi:anti-sigma factor RsiW
VTARHPQDDLPGLLLGELPPATAVAVDRHLAGCDPCRRDLAAVAVASSALRDLSRLPLAEAPGLPPMRPPAGDPDGPGDRDPLPASVLRDRPRRSRWLLGAAAAEAHMRGAGDDQIMSMTAQGLPRPPAGAYDGVWLVGDAGQDFPVGVLAPNGQGIWGLPADVAARYRAIDVTLEPADGNPSRSQRTVLRGAYA